MSSGTGGQAGFLAEYFIYDPADRTELRLSDIDFDTTPVTETVVGSLNSGGHDPFWNGGPSDYFAARYTADLTVQEAGRYTFYLTSDDGSQLYLDGSRVINNDGTHSATRKVVRLDLEAGEHPLEVLYFEWRGRQTLKLEWSGPDTDGQVVPLESVTVPGGDGDDGGAGEPAPGTGGQAGFLAEYFIYDPADRTELRLSDIDFDTTPVTETVVSSLNSGGYDPFWNGGPSDYFAARYTADLTVQEAGRYTFYLTSDDGSQLYLDGSRVINNDGTHGVERKVVRLDLEAGEHPLELLYFDWRGRQTLRLEWSGPDTDGQVVPLESVTVPGGDGDDGGAGEPAPGTGGDDGDTGTGEDQTGDDGDTGTDGDQTGDDGDTGTDGDQTGDGGQPPTPPRVPGGGDGDGPDRLAPVEVAPSEIITVSGGRVTTLKLDTGKSIASVEIIDQPAHGTVSVNPDNSIALVLSGSDFDGRLTFDYRLRYADGSSETITHKVDVAQVTQGAGWGLGQHYMLAEDADGDIIVETGDNHRKVYITESKDGLTRADIAAREGVSAATVTGEWLVAHPQYGGSEALALAADVGHDLWFELTNEHVAPNSHWLLLERGYTYSDLGTLVTRGSIGESALHPIHITAWGEGAMPVVDSRVSFSQKPSEYLVISNLRLTEGIGVSTGDNVLVTDTEVTNEMINLRFGENFTLHDSSVSYTASFGNDGDTWTGVSQGILSKGTKGVLLDGNIFHHNAWQDGFHEDGSIEGGVSPNGFSHNVYMQWDTRDVTYRDNISSMSASVGAQFRGGAFIEDSLFTDNNVALNMLGGDYKDFGHVGNFSFFADNVVTSAGYKEAPRIGAKGWGVINKGYETAWVDNIVTHFANPDDAKELADKPITQFATSSDGTLVYDNTKVFNWLGADPKRWKDAALDRNLEGVDTTQAIQTTIQRYAAQLTSGQTATIDGLMDYLLGLAETQYDDQISARDIVAYFQNGFGMSLDGPNARDHRFMPNDLAAGVRWDNRINWSNDELPGVGDTADLGGNRVYFGTLTTDLRNLDLGPDGHLSVTSGRLSVNGTLSADGDAGRIDIDGAGQFWTEGYADGTRLEIAAQGGRFANTGDFTGSAAIHVGGDAQAILATSQDSMVLKNGSELRIEGSEASVGFDGPQARAAVLQMANNATLSFVADADGFSTLGEFRSGAWDQAGSPVRSGVSLDGTLKIDMSDYTGGAGTYQLVSVDALDGVFDDIEIHGLSSSLNAHTVIDYQADELLLQISSGRGRLSNEIKGTAGNLSDENRALADALRAGEGAYDGGAPTLSVENGALPDLLF